MHTVIKHTFTPSSPRYFTLFLQEMPSKFERFRQFFTSQKLQMENLSKIQAKKRLDKIFNAQAQLLKFVAGNQQDVKLSLDLRIKDVTND